MELLAKYLDIANARVLLFNYKGPFSVPDCERLKILYKAYFNGLGHDFYQDPALVYTWWCDVLKL